MKKQSKYSIINPRDLVVGDIFYLSWIRSKYKFEVVSGKGLKCTIKTELGPEVAPGKPYWLYLESQGIQILMETINIHDKAFNDKLKKLMRVKK